jgi:K+-transporting ATPase ATPase A chain
VQNFLSAATGIAVAFALIRGFARQGTQAIGNFWVDLVRITLYVLLPLSLCFALVLAQSGRDPELFAVPGRHHARADG